MTDDVFGDVIKTVTLVVAVLNLTKKTNPFEQVLNIVTTGAIMAMVMPIVNQQVLAITALSSALGTVSTLGLSIEQISKKLDYLSNDVDAVKSELDEMKSTLDNLYTYVTT